MSRWWLKALVVLALLLGLAGALLRFGAAALVRSEEFRSTTERLAERALRPFLPGALVHIQDTNMVGLATLTLAELTIRSGKNPEATLQISDAFVTPSLWSLIAPGPMELDAEAHLATSEGQLTAHGAVSLAALLGRDDEGEALLTGHLREVDAAPITRLLLAETDADGPAFALAKGKISGAFSYAKPFGARDDAGKKVGNVSIKLSGPMWSLGGEHARVVTLADIAVDAELRGNELRALAPVIFADQTGSASVAGALTLPKRADRGLAWNLRVEAKGGTDLPRTLGEILRCKIRPEGLAFTVEGPLSAPACTASP